MPQTNGESSPWFLGAPSRRGLFAAEIVAVGVAIVADSALALLTYDVRPSSSPLFMLFPAGEMATVLAVLRRRFPGAVTQLAVTVAGLSLIATTGEQILAALGTEQPPFPVGAEIVAMSLLVGASCRRLAARRAVAIAGISGVAMVTAPLLRYGVDSQFALIAILGALGWGAGLAMGMVLRDADNRRESELASVRTSERLRLARELHDLVAHHVSGIVVRVHAARTLATNPRAPEQDPVGVYTDIEQAGTEALTAMRKLVGMLRTDDDESLPHSTGFGDAVREAAGDNATMDIAQDLDELPVTPELATTAHRIVLEALTNARRHSPDAGEVHVTGHLDGDHIVLAVDNDNAPPPSGRPGYGLVGMTERVSALGGTVHAGPEPGRRWRVTARLPLAATVSDRGGVL